MKLNNPILNILKNTDELCGKYNISYVLNFYFTRLAVLEKEVPSQVNSTEIFVPKSEIEKLYEVIKKETSYVLEFYEGSVNLDYGFNIIDKNSVFYDVAYPQKTQSTGCFVTVLPIIPAYEKDKKSKKAYKNNVLIPQKINYWCSRFNFPAFKLLKIFFPRKKYSVRKNVSTISAAKYKKVSVPNFYFEHREAICLNNEIFYSGWNPKVFCKYYYHNALISYPDYSKVNELRTITVPNMECVKVSKISVLPIVIYDKVIAFLNKYIKKNQVIFTREREYFFRTSDRFEMSKEYTPIKDLCLELYKEKNWDELEVIMNNYYTITRKYYKKNIIFAFDMDYYNILTELLINKKRDIKMLIWLENNRKKAKDYLDYVNSYCDENVG